MKSAPPTKIIKSKIINTKIDYSHIQSRLYNSLSKSKSKSKYKDESQIKIIRHSIQKIQQIGQQKYKQAMKHMQRFNKYEQQKKIRNLKKNQIIDTQCTFKPKINKKKFNSTYSSLYSSTLTSLYGSKSSLLNNQSTKDIKSQLNSSRVLQKKKSTNMNNILIQNYQSKNDNHQQANNKKFFKKPNQFDIGDRLINWGKTRDAKVISKAIEIQLSRSNSRQSTYSNNLSKKSSNSKILSYNELHAKKLNLSLSTIINQSQQNYYNSYTSKLSSLSITPKGDSKKLSSYANKSSASLYFNSATMTPKGSSINLNQKNYESMKLSFLKNQANNRNDEILQELPTTKRKFQKFYTQVNPEIYHETYGQRLLAKQSQRGQGSFYLRQARANIMNNYNKTDVLIKDKKYTKKFSIFNFKEPSFK